MNLDSPQSPTARGDVSSYFDIMDHGSTAQQLSMAATPRRSAQPSSAAPQQTPQRHPLLATPAGHRLPPQATPQRRAPGAGAHSREYVCACIKAVRFFLAPVLLFMAVF
jgi:hypothetical protein